MRILISLIFSIISSICYRAGGMGKDAAAMPKWIPKFMRKSWVRDWLIPFISLGYLLTLWRPYSSRWWELLPCIILNSGALSTYWDWLFDGEDNFYMHGLMCGLAVFPLYWAGLNWYAIVGRAIVCGLAMGLWSKQIGNDVLEEYGRGVIHTATIPLLLI